MSEVQLSWLHLQVHIPGSGQHIGDIFSTDSVNSNILNSFKPNPINLLLYINHGATKHFRTIPISQGFVTS